MRIYNSDLPRNLCLINLTAIWRKSISEIKNNTITLHCSCSFINNLVLIPSSFNSPCLLQRQVSNAYFYKGKIKLIAFAHLSFFYQFLMFCKCLVNPMPFCNPTVLPPSGTGKSVLTEDLGNLMYNNKIHKP